jgi:hypothetical protein
VVSRVLFWFSSSLRCRNPSCSGNGRYPRLDAVESWSLGGVLAVRDRSCRRRFRSSSRPVVNYVGRCSWLVVLVVVRFDEIRTRGDFDLLEESMCTILPRVLLMGHRIYGRYVSTVVPTRIYTRTPPTDAILFRVPNPINWREWSTVENEWEYVGTNQSHPCIPPSTRSNLP